MSNLSENTKAIQDLITTIEGLPEDRYEIGKQEGSAKLAKVVDGSVTELTADDLYGASVITRGLFEYCTKLSSVGIPDTIKTIGVSAFDGLSSLTSVTFGKNVSVIDMSAFRKCKGLVTLDIPNSVNTIGNSTFHTCTALESVTIGTGIKTISYMAFQDCTSLRSVTVKAETPPKLDHANAWLNVPTDCAFYVPVASVEAYKAATNWSARADYIFPLEE